VHTFGRLSLVVLTISCITGCGPKGARLQKSVVPPDRSLYESGKEYLDKSQYVKARLAWQTLISTYGESELCSNALFALADSYYDEGGTENLLQAEDQYKNFIVFFPIDPKVPDAMMKIIALNRKMTSSPDRDPSYAYKTEAAIKKMLELHPDSDFSPIAREFLKEIQEILARGNFDVGQFYASKGNYPAAESRYLEVINRYKDYSGMDAIYFGLADALEKSNKPEDASFYYDRIARAYPDSGYFERARSRLDVLGKPIPPVDPQPAREHQPRENEGFHPLKPFIRLAETLRGRDSDDYYLRAKKFLAGRNAGEPSDETKPTDDLLIQTTLTKDASGKTDSTTVLGNGTESTKSGAGKKSGEKRPNKK